jgi:hypothetical protein
MSDIKEYDDKKLPTANVIVLEADQDDHEKQFVPFPFSVDMARYAVA